jgi:hypothetical protein
MGNALRIAFVAGLLAVSAVVGWTAMSFREPFEPEAQVNYRPIQVNGDGYASSQTCKACHPSHYETWHDSYHRSMTQVASPETVRADFNGIQIADVNGRTPMRLERRGSQFWAEMDDPDTDGKGDRPLRIKRQVVMITGSHHQQVYWYRTDHTRVLGPLPAMYLIAEQRWIPRSAAFLSPNDGSWPSETGRWNRVCVNCHATHGKGFNTPPGWVPIEPHIADTKAAEFGIACEACHGPSERHVALNRSPFRRYWFHLTGEPDRTAVQPQRLNSRLSSETCGQCHSVWDFYDAAGEREANEAGAPYRPGDELGKTRFVARPAQDRQSPKMKSLLLNNPRFVTDSFWSDGMIRVSGREYNGLIDSPCFKNARDEQRTMSCFSCHTMHKAENDPRPVEEWADSHQVAAGMNGNEACLQCHVTFRTNTSAHTRHRDGSTGSSCYNCHMPYTTYGLLRAMRSHQISSPTVSASVHTGRPNACNLCHLDKTLGWASEYLEKWYGTPRIPLDRDQQAVAASLLWLLRGDAGQRALVAWSMGWPPAQQISGTTWMPPFLSILLNDPYDAVRFVAYRSLRSQPGFAGFQYDFVGPAGQRVEDRFRAMNIWRNTRGPARTDPALLLDAEGWPRVEAMNTLHAQRDDRAVNLVE